MTPETLAQAKKIEARLREIGRTQEQWRDAEESGFYVLASFLGLGPRLQPSERDPIPAPILRFRTACLDVLATEEAALRAEMEAL